MTAEKIWFGTHIGKRLPEIPSGYLRWMVENFDPVPMWRDTIRKSPEEVQAMEDRMHDLLRAAAEELSQRGEFEDALSAQPNQLG